MLKHRFTLPILVVAALVLALVPVLSVRASAPASGVTPVFVADNPNCADLGYDFGFKPQPEPPPTGVYTFPGTAYTVSITSDGTYFDWSSTLGVDAVIVKGGPNSNVYYYDPESTGDTQLVSPNNSSGGPAAISHIEFCYDYEVDVSKTAATTFTRTYAWDITKSVSPDTWDLFVGDSGSSTYTVSVTKTGHTDSDWAVSGTITVANNTPYDATLTGVSDVISGFGAVAVDCGVTFPYTLPVGASLSCSYSSPLPNGAARVNTATVTTTGTVKGGAATADVTFGSPTTVVNGSVNVVDTNGMSWAFSDSGSKTYSQTFKCGQDVGLHGNKATIVETGQSDNATVVVNCYEPKVVKTAQTYFERDYQWTIDKRADQTALNLSVGQQFLVNYAIDVNAVPVDSAWKVSGTITVTNPHPSQAMPVSVVDSVGGVSATLDCGGSLSVPAGGTATCGYEAALTAGVAGTNTATVTLNGLTFPASAAYTFGDPDVVTDECAQLFDSYVTGVVATYCVAGFFTSTNGFSPLSPPDTYTYTRWIGPYECGVYEVLNKADIVPLEGGDPASDSWTVDVTVPCEGGCSLTPGYWKTHSEYGPAPYDDTWAMMPDGADTPFFLSGQTYHDVLWTPPKGGNPYYILAHAYIAAELNFLNGADPADAQAAFDAATVLFETWTPDEIAELKGKSGKELYAEFVALAETLDEYNNGLIGPGHCSEEGYSAPEGVG